MSLHRWAVVGAAALALTLGVAACNEEKGPRIVTVGNPELGKRAISRYGCGSCHTIPGVKGADSLVGPPLIHFSKRSFIAGRLPNNEENLTRWILDPQAVEPGTAMPNLQVTEQDARNIAAYLETIR
ncbi:MAG: c-type cytochrome [Actinomycetota bacterium]|nr:c-type cytochrome [Actinomycetota bacterium]